jgi:hypothetical protein
VRCAVVCSSALMAGCNMLSGACAVNCRGLPDSRVVKGMVLRRDTEGTIKLVQDAKVAVYAQVCARVYATVCATCGHHQQSMQPRCPGWCSPWLCLLSQSDAALNYRTLSLLQPARCPLCMLCMCDFCWCCRSC